MDWLSQYANPGTRRTYAYALGLPIGWVDAIGRRDDAGALTGPATATEPQLAAPLPATSKPGCTPWTPSAPAPAPASGCGPPSPRSTPTSPRPESSPPTLPRSIAAASDCRSAPAMPPAPRA